MMSQCVIGYDAHYLELQAIMEKLYTTLLPYGQVHCMAWSGTNLVAISLSEEIPENVADGHQRFEFNSATMHAKSKSLPHLARCLLG